MSFETHCALSTMKATLVSFPKKKYFMTFFKIKLICDVMMYIVPTNECMIKVRYLINVSLYHFVVPGEEI